ncbi:unnamed protein product [Scytosiphon promiscuus]
MAGNHHSCSREDSRQARKIAVKKIYPLLGADPSSIIPPECPLHPELDMYKHQELNKALVSGRSDTFQCGYCQKQFKTEFYMDRHMDNKHADRLHLADPDEFGGAADADAELSGHCLGDLCPALGCGAYAPDSCTRAPHAPLEGSASERWLVGSCFVAQLFLTRNKHGAVPCLCFDAEGGVAAPNESVSDSAAGKAGYLYDHFVWQFCEHLACDDHHRPYAPPVDGDRAGRRHPLPGGSAGMGSGVGMGRPRVFLIAVVVFGLIVFYASMAVGCRSRSTRNDLRPAKRDRGRGRGGSGGVGGGGSGTAVASGVRGSSGQLRRRARPPLS